MDYSLCDICPFCDHPCGDDPLLLGCLTPYEQDPIYLDI